MHGGWALMPRKITWDQYLGSPPQFMAFQIPCLAHFKNPNTVSVEKSDYAYTYIYILQQNEQKIQKVMELLSPEQEQYISLWLWANYWHLQVLHPWQEAVADLYSHPWHPDLWAICNILAEQQGTEPADISGSQLGSVSLLPHFSAVEMLWTPILARGAGLQLKREQFASEDV